MLTQRVLFDISLSMMQCQIFCSGGVFQGLSGPCNAINFDIVYAVYVCMKASTNMIPFNIM